MIALSNLNQAPDKKGSWKAPAGRDFSGPSSGYVVACEGGYYLGQRGSGKAIDLKGKEIRSFKGGDRMQLHTRNFLDAVRAQDKNLLNSEIEVGHDSTGWCNLANVAFQTGGDYSRAKAESIMPNLEAWGALLDNMEESLAKFGVKADSDSIKMSPILTHDPKSEQFTGEHAKTANQYLKRQYRAGYAVPDLT